MRPRADGSSTSDLPPSLDPAQLRRLRRSLDQLVDQARAPRPDSDDPVRLVHRHTDPDDQEIAALVAATFAFGRVDGLIRASGLVLDRLGERPRRAIDRGVHRERRFLRGFRYRWIRGRDVVAMLEGARRVTAESGTLGVALQSRVAEQGSFEAGFAAWVRSLRAAAELARRPSRGLTFLLADPRRGSACKRWRLFLRWMVRAPGAIDPGTWHGRFDPADLILPLDAHWKRIAPRLGLVAPDSRDDRMARAITRALAAIRTADPLVYDYAVCHHGISGRCPPRLRPGHCAVCVLRTACAVGRGRTLERTQALR